MNRFRNHCLLRAGSLRLVITYFDPLGVGLLFVFFAVLFLILGSKGSGDFAVEGGKFGFEGFKFVFFAPCARQDGFEGRHIDTFLSARSRCWLIVSGSFSRALTKFMQAAWAITIHKSQGLTFEHAIIDASHSFAHGQTYVALSRCKSLEGMVLGAPLGRARKTKPTKAPKEPKVPTAKISYDMFISGMAVDRIAAERRLTPGTVFNHLAQYVERGTLPIEQLVPQEHIDEIRNHARTHPQDMSVTQIKEAVSQAVSYDEIRIVRKEILF